MNTRLFCKINRAFAQNLLAMKRGHGLCHIFTNNFKICCTQDALNNKQCKVIRLVTFYDLDIVV